MKVVDLNRLYSYKNVFILQWAVSKKSDVWALCRVV